MRVLRVVSTIGANIERRGSIFSYFSTRTSLIPETLMEIQGESVEKPRPTLEERKKRMRALKNLNIPSFNSFLQSNSVAIDRKLATIFQMNIGLYCNQACKHCHVESSPRRKEAMTQKIIDRCFQIIDNSPSIKTIDITGGAPELIYGFRDIVKRARQRNLEVIDRCNLTVLMEPGQEDLHHFLAEHNVRVVASLPCYSELNVNQQRGGGVFKRSIEGLQLLNSVGYGKNESLILDLMYNPNGAFLPSNQKELEIDYKQELLEKFNIVFNHLYTLTNMPIKRFADLLYKSNKLEEYLQLLVNTFNSKAVDGVMCTNTISVNYNGEIFDCDFNQQLNLYITSQDLLPQAEPSSSASSSITPLSSSVSNCNVTRKENTNTLMYLQDDVMSNNTPNADKGMVPLTIFDIHDVQDMLKYKVRTDSHCFGCTAGSGSSCQGSTVS